MKTKSANTRRPILVVGFCLVLLIGCVGGDPEPLPSGAETNANPNPTGQATSEQSNPPAYQEAIQLHDEAETAVTSALSELQSIRSAQDFEAKLPTVKKHLEAMLKCVEQVDAKMATLDAEQKQELNRRFMADSTLPATFQKIGQELKRITQLSGITPETLADFMGFMLQFNQRAMQISAKSKANLAESRAKPRSMSRLGHRSHAGHGRLVPMDGPNVVQITLKGENSANRAAVLKKLGEFNSGGMRAINEVIQFGEVKDFDGLVAAIKERVGTIEEADPQTRKIIVLVDSTKIPPKPK